MSFDEQPDGDIHGECAAEIHRLEQWQNEASAMLATFIGLSSRPDELEWSKVAIKVPALLAEEAAYKTEEHDCCAADLIMWRKSAEAAIAENVELRALLGNAADTVSIAMRNAWQLGQTDKQNAKPGETYACFHRLVGETIAKIESMEECNEY